jgi:hypothetical protein
VNEENLKSGYVYLFRSFLDWEWYTDANTVRLFLHCLIKANYKDKKWHGITIKRGEFVTSYATLSAETCISIRGIRTALKHLESTGEVTCTKSNKYTILKVNNYDCYQRSDTQSDNQMTSNRHATDTQPTTTNKRKKEIKEIKENIYSQPAVEGDCKSEKKSAPKKEKFGEFGNVLLTPEENEKIKAKGYDYLIPELDLYIEKTGKKYKSHYATLLSWGMKRINVQSGNPPIKKEAPPLPEWYANTAPEKPSEEKLAAALARQKERKEREKEKDDQ